MIAEIGVNHAGSVAMAKEMIEAAVESGADAVKFQTFTAESLVSKDTPKVKYQERTTDINESHYNMIKSLEFKKDDHIPVLEHAKKFGIDFISTPYDIESAEFLISIGVDVFKTASADIVDLSLHHFIASHAKHAIVSTGMATLGEIEQVVAIYEAYQCPMTLLHCVSNYPCEYSSLNLRAMTTLAQTFQCNVGYSDHAIGYIPAVCAVSLGAKVIEKHFTLDKKMIGPDHKASSEPAEFKELVSAVRIAEITLGSSRKTVQQEELQMREVSRKSLFLKHDIEQGGPLSKADFCLKRPGTGLPESMLEIITGCVATRALTKDSMLKYGDFSE